MTSIPYLKKYPVSNAIETEMDIPVQVTIWNLDILDLNFNSIPEIQCKICFIHWPKQNFIGMLQSFTPCLEIILECIHNFSFGMACGGIFFSLLDIFLRYNILVFLFFFRSWINEDIIFPETTSKPVQALGKNMSEKYMKQMINRHAVWWPNLKQQYSFFNITPI